MLTRQERIALLLLATVAAVLIGVTALIEHCGYSSFAVPYDPSLPDGTLVSHQGEVKKVTVTKTGGHLLLDLAGVLVFIPGGAVDVQPVVEGEPVSVTGTLATYRGSREIVLRSVSDIRYLNGTAW